VSETPVNLDKQGKGRPTPKRSEKQRRRSGPVAPPPQTRKEAAARLRAKQAEGRKQLRAGVAANDEKAMLPRDAGPLRSFLRDVVDSRRNVGVILLPVALILVLAQFSGQEQVLSVAVTIWTAAVLAMLLDVVLITVKVRKGLKERFPDEGKAVRHVGYALLRSTVFRRFRMPPPKVVPGASI